MQAVLVTNQFNLNQFAVLDNNLKQLVGRKSRTEKVFMG